MKRTFQRLLAFALPFWGQIALATLLGFATIGSSVGLLTTSAYLIAHAALRPSIADLQVAIVGVRFFGIARGIFRYLERNLSHQVNFRLLARLRVWFYRALEPLAPARLLHYGSGDLLSRIVADIETLENLYVRVIAPPLVALMVGVLTWLLMASFALPLAWASVGALALAGLALPWLARRMAAGDGRRLIQTRAEMNVALVDLVQGMADLLAFGREQDHLTRVQRLNREMVQLQARMVRVTGLSDALTGFLMNLATLAVLILAIPLVRAADLDGPSLAVLVLAVIASFEAVAPLSLAFQYLENNLAAGRRLFEIVDADPAVVDPIHPPTLPARFDLRVQNLSFRYNPEAPLVLDDVSFSLNAGGRIAVVGPSGAGKSTLIHLLLRFWDCPAGQIYLDGRDIRSYGQEALRGAISVISQSPYLFNATVRENLLLARPDASVEEIVNAAQRAQIHDFLTSLPEGYGTWIGEQGLALSGGERQRLAVARTLLKDAPFLILDEATANLDAVTEKRVVDELYALMQNRTVLIVTHRLVGLEMVDEILVLDQGRVMERGRHHELMQAAGIYRRMWELQNQTLP
jgi:thiol reductant ABC exporter CydC subunit